MKAIPSWILCVVIAIAAYPQSGIHLKAQSHRREVRGGPLPQHFILEFRTYPGPQTRRELARRGIRVLQYVPENGLMVSVRTTPNLAGFDLQSVLALDPRDKLSPLLDTQEPPGYVVIFQLDTDLQQARNLVRSHRLEIVENRALLGWQLLLTGNYDDVVSLAADDSVAYILPASLDLLTGEPVIGCAGAIAEAGSVGEYVLASTGWPKNTAGVSLNYFFESLTDKLDQSTARGEIERAFREWTKYTNLTLSPGQKAGLYRSIDILFARGAHGDPYPFDGPGGVLAHTFYPSPPNAETIAGDMHFDADEAWHTGSSVDLFSVALHEAGHALGLGHSDQPGAVMYPYYRLNTGLTADDIAGIRALYGDNTTPPAHPPSTDPTPTPAPTPTPTPTPAPSPTPPSKGPDTVPPALTILSPPTTITSTSASTITISGTATDNVGVAGVKWANGFGDGGTAAGTGTWSAAVPLLVGNNSITVTAFDAAGNSSWRAITIVRH